MIVLMDMDVVIANFVGGLIRSLQINITHDEYATWDHHKVLGFSDSHFWKATKVGTWWLDLEPYDYAKEFVAKVREKHEVVFSTSPGIDSKCASQKVEWLRKHKLMSRSKNDFMLGPRKELMAGSGAVLIDDSDANVSRFMDAGGTAILFPQPWNELRILSADKIGYTLQELEKYR